MCAAQYRQLEERAQDLAAAGVRVVLVAVDREREPLDAFVRDKGAALSLVHDRYGLWVKKLGIERFPVTVVLDRDMKVEAIYGVLKSDLFERLVAK